MSSQPFSQSSTTSSRSIWELSQPNQNESVKRKSFEDLGPRSKKARTEKLMQALQKTSEEENLSPLQIIGYLGHRVTYNNNRALSKLFKSIEKGEDITTKKQIPIELALFLKEKCSITKRHWVE